MAGTNGRKSMIRMTACFEQSIPVTMRPRARALLSRLKAKPDVVTWDKTGQVKIEGESILGSNISDLVSDAMRLRKGFNPTGAKEFFQALSKLNVPRDLVRNQNRWEEVLGGTSGTMATPKSSSQVQKLLKSNEGKATPMSADRYPVLKLLGSYKGKETPLFNNMFVKVYALFGLNQDTHFIYNNIYSINFLQHWTKPATGCFNAAL